MLWCSGNRVIRSVVCGGVGVTFPLYSDSSTPTSTPVLDSSPTRENLPVSKEDLPAAFPAGKPILLAPVSPTPRDLGCGTADFQARGIGLVVTHGSDFYCGTAIPGGRRQV